MCSVGGVRSLFGWRNKVFLDYSIPTKTMANYKSVWQIVRHRSRFARVATNVYVPTTDGIVPARQSIAKLPQNVKPVENTQKSKTSADIFKSIMGEIFTTKSKRLIAVEGLRQVDDAIAFGLQPKILFLLKSLKTYPKNVLSLVENSPISEPKHDVSLPEIHRISLGVLQEWSSLQTPPGIIGIFEKPKTVLQPKVIHKPLPLTVILDNVREPGNLGSIMRTAAGIGCSKVIMSKGCVDPWETKTLRGGNGAQFLVPMMTNIDLECIHLYVPLPEFISREATLSENDAKTADKENVINNNVINKRCGIGVFLADLGTGADKYGMPIVDYTAVQYSNLKSIVLVLGGETSSISDTTRKAMADLQKYYPDDIKMVSRIKIPMQLPIDSLNVANAFGIIGYEILRQITNAS